MIGNYLKLAIRNLLRIKEYFFINVFGLAIGMACTILVMLHIRGEFMYDSFHPAANRLYRVYIHTNLGGIESKAAVTSQRFAFGLKEMVPDIEQSCRIFRLDRDIIMDAPVEKILPGNSLLFVDSTFFELFGFKLLEGNPSTCFDQPRSVVLSQSMAKQFFPEGALGKTIRIENKKDWKVTGIVEDCPKNTHINYQALASMSSVEMPDTAWTSNFLYTYFRIRDISQTRPSKNSPNRLSPAEDRIMTAFLSKAEEEIKSALGSTSIEEGNRENNFFLLRLQKVQSIHLFSTLKYEMSHNVNIRTILILFGIAILIMLIACINYANLSTARLSGRVREIGIRKTLGSHSGEITRQFLAESIIISFISLFFALVFIELVFSQIQELLSTSVHNLQQTLIKMSPVIFLFTLLIGILAGLYPAFYITRFTPAEILRQQKQFGGGSRGLRGLLVILQFVFSIVIIYSTTTIYRQLRYVQSRGVGFESENIIVLENALGLGDKREEFRNRLLLITGVENVSFSNSVPGKLFNMQSFQSDGDQKRNLLISVMNADSLFIKTYGMKLISGGEECKSHENSDTVEVVINQAACSYFGLDNELGAVIKRNKFDYGTKSLIVRGVVNDFNYESLHAKIQPLIIIPSGLDQVKYVSIKLNRNDPEVTDQIKQLWAEYLSQNSFSAFSINENFGLFYGEEKVTGQIAMLFSFFAIFIACMGLYSLLALTTVYRTKEIGIRKVLGAGTRELVLMLTKEIVRLIVISGMIALPISFLISSYWLSRFAYHIELNVINYFLVFLAVFFVAIFTIYRQLWRTINSDPADSLRFE